MKYLSPQASLRSNAEQLSLLSYNILLPNSIEGWWIPKCFVQGTPQEARTWKSRKEKLENQLLTARADIICIQEAAASSFNEDFSALFQAGYEAVLHQKNNLFRCATFFRTEKLTLISTRHRFRTLVHIFQWNDELLAIINVHLSGGPHPKIRCSQLHEALQHLKKMCNQLAIDIDTLPIAMMGDFNCNPTCTPVDEFLSSGFLSTEARDPMFPSMALTKKGKRHDFAGLSNLYATYFPEHPPTLYGMPLVNHFCLPHSPQQLMQYRKDGTLRQLLRQETLDKIEQLFRRYASNGSMNRNAVEKWLYTINGGLRGDAWKAAQDKQYHLILEDFITIYTKKLENGLWWSLAADLECHNIPLPTVEAKMHQEALDHIYLRGFKPQAIRHIDTDIRKGLPNQKHPSDHLPLGCIVEKRSDISS